MKNLNGRMVTNCCEICGKHGSTSHTKCSALKAIMYGGAGENKKPKKSSVNRADLYGKFMAGK